MTRNFRFSHLTNSIFLLEFDNQYDVGMHFLRLQEFYESPNSSFRNQLFDIWDYIKWYSKEHDGVFSYPTDWTGFNVPCDCFRDLYHAKKECIPGYNKYDKFMKQILQLIESQLGSSAFYLIGTKTDETDTIEHELAHGLWYINAIYQNEQYQNIDKLPNDLKGSLKLNLDSIGYVEKVFNDEIQAYMSTGLTDQFIGSLSKKEINKHMKPFKETFNRFYRS